MSILLKWHNVFCYEVSGVVSLFISFSGRTFLVQKSKKQGLFYIEGKVGIWQKKDVSV
jgi:hypothetical protein